MSKILKELLILVAIGGLIWLGVAYFDFFPENPSLISEETEEEIGERYLEAVLNSTMFEESENLYIDSIVQLICNRLESAIEEPLYSYNYVVVDNNMVNAFTLPGGNIVITTGLIEYCISAEELAGVIAHELGHAEEKHILSRLIKELGIEIITSGDVFVLGEITKTITSSGFDRKQEAEADAYACSLLEKSKIEPRILASLFRRLKTDMDSEVMEHFEIIASHPNFSSRIKNILSYEVSENFQADTIAIDWELVKQELVMEGADAKE